MCEGSNLLCSTCLDSFSGTRLKDFTIFVSQRFTDMSSIKLVVNATIARYQSFQNQE